MNAAPPPTAKNLSTRLTDLALAAVLLLFGLPFMWIAVLAFDRRAGTAWPFPSQPTLDNFRALFDEMKIGRSIENSFLVVGLATILAVLLSALAGFGLSRLTWRHKTAAAYGLLLLYTFPLSVTMVPINDLGRRLELLDTYHGLILAQTAITLPFLIWLMKGAFDAVPKQIQEAAEVDGASAPRVWVEILLPLVRPGLAVAAGFAFLNAWAEVLLVAALIRGQDMSTVSLRFMTAAQSPTDAPVVAALGVLYIAPVLALFLFLRRAIAGGIGSAGQLH